MARTKKVVAETKADNANVEVLNSLLKELEPKVVQKEWNGITINIKDKLTNVDAIRFTKVVTDLCFAESGEYLPEVFEYAYNYAVVSFYSDILLPNTIEDQYKILMFTDLVQEILNCVDSKQFESIFDATNEKIDFKVKTEIDAVKKQAEDMIHAVDSLLTKFNDTFGEFNDKEIKGLVKALSSGKIDEKKIMDAYLDTKNSKRK